MTLLERIYDSYCRYAIWVGVTPLPIEVWRSVTENTSYHGM